MSFGVNYLGLNIISKTADLQAADMLGVARRKIAVFVKQPHQQNNFLHLMDYKPGFRLVTCEDKFGCMHWKSTKDANFALRMLMEN